MAPFPGATRPPGIDGKLNVVKRVASRRRQGERLRQVLVERFGASAAFGPFQKVEQELGLGAAVARHRRLIAFHGRLYLGNQLILAVFPTAIEADAKDMIEIDKLVRQLDPHWTTLSAV